MTRTTMIDIANRARQYAEARAALAGIVSELNAGIAALKREHLPDLKRAVARAAEQHDALRNLIEAAPALFEKPKTVTLHGIRLGYMKLKGGIVWDDTDAVVAAVLKHLPDQAEALLRWTARPLKEAINNLDVATLRRIGCRVEDTGEAIFIKAADSEVDKMVDALLRGATEEVDGVAG